MEVSDSTFLVSVLSRRLLASILCRTSEPELIRVEDGMRNAAPGNFCPKYASASPSGSHSSGS